MPPTSRSTHMHDSPDPLSKKRGRSLTRPPPETPTKKPKGDKMGTPKSDTEVPDMSTFLPQTLLGRLQSSENADEFKAYLRFLTAVLFFKVRGIPEPFYQPIITTSVPSGIKHSSSELIEELKGLNEDLVKTLLAKFRGYADTLVKRFGDENVQKAREVAQAHRDRKTQIPRPFPNKDSVKEYLVLSTRDLVEIWAPILGFVDPGYIDNPGNSRVNWLHNLEESAYVVISRMASGIIITKRVYNTKSMVTDLGSTSCHRTPIPWPEYQVPFSYTSIPAHWGLLSETWPRRSGSVANKDPANSTPTDLDMGSDDELDCDEEPLSDEAMDVVWAVNENDDSDQKDMIDAILDFPGAFATYQLDEAYCTEESSLIAQLNTSGLITYTIQRIETRMQTLKHFLVLAQTRLEEAQHALEVLEEKERRNKLVEAKYNEIMGTVLKVQGEVSRRQSAVEKDAKIYQSAKNTVCEASSRRGVTLSSILGQRNSPKEEPEGRPGVNRIRLGSNHWSQTPKDDTKRPTSSHTPKTSTPAPYYGQPGKSSSAFVGPEHRSGQEATSQDPEIDNVSLFGDNSQDEHGENYKGLPSPGDIDGSEDEKDPDHPLEHLKIKDN